MDNERTAAITIGGEEYALVLTTRATKQIAGRYGGLEKLGDKLMKSENFELAISEIVWLITLLNDMERELEECSDDADDMGEEVEDAGDAAEESEKKFSGLGAVLKSVGAAMGAVVVAAGAATVKLAGTVVQQFGELEQNLGGAVAVYGDYANELMSISEEAYRTMGTSQSEYLATANKMGVLFQGSGVSQQRSLQLTTDAMQRAADMASVMGIETEAAFILEGVIRKAKFNGLVGVHPGFLIHEMGQLGAGQTRANFIGIDNALYGVGRNLLSADYTAQKRGYAEAYPRLERPDSVTGK